MVVTVNRPGAGSPHPLSEGGRFYYDALLAGFIFNQPVDLWFVRGETAYRITFDRSAYRFDPPSDTLVPPEVETNLVWFEVGGKHGSARRVAERLKAEGVLVAALGERVVRAVTHLDVSRADCETAAAAIRRLAE